MSENKGVSPPAVGASSMLVIFAVLCLSIFALLSISTVQANQRLGNSAETAVLGYYEADCQAEEILARLRAGEIPDGVTETDGVYSYLCQISDTQGLLVSVTVADEDVYDILEWQVVSTQDWEADDKLHVWTGQEQ